MEGFQDCSDVRNRVRRECGQREALQISTLGRLTILHLALPMLGADAQYRQAVPGSPCLSHGEMQSLGKTLKERLGSVPCGKMINQAVPVIQPSLLKSLGDIAGGIQTAVTLPQSIRQRFA